MLIRTSTPTGLVISIEDVKAQTEVELDDISRDPLLERYIRAATAFIESRTSRFLLPISLELRLFGWCNPLRIPAAPIRSITELVYLDEDDAEQTVDAANYTFARSTEGGSLYFIDNYTFPTLSKLPEAVTARFMAGYDDPWASGAGGDPETHPDISDGQMVAMLAATWFTHRESLSDRRQQQIPDGMQMLIDDRRIYR